MITNSIFSGVFGLPYYRLASLLINKDNIDIVSEKC